MQGDLACAWSQPLAAMMTAKKSFSLVWQLDASFVWTRDLGIVGIDNAKRQ